jgi:hypothetical protein
VLKRAFSSGPCVYTQRSVLFCCTPVAASGKPEVDESRESKHMLPLISSESASNEIPSYSLVALIQPSSIRLWLSHRHSGFLTSRIPTRGACGVQTIPALLCLLHPNLSREPVETTRPTFNAGKHIEIQYGQAREVSNVALFFFLFCLFSLSFFFSIWDWWATKRSKWPQQCI